MAEVCVVNASPLIFLGRGGHLPLLRSVAAQVLGLPGCRAVIDDLAGRKCAALLGIPVIGTLGIVLRARRQGIIPAARPIVEDLLRGGMFLSRALLDRALALVGE